MLVAHIEVWDGGDPGKRTSVGTLLIANRSGLAKTSTYEVWLEPDGRKTFVHGHQRSDGWVPLMERALAALQAVPR